MADATYQPKIYKQQGGSNLTVTSSGTVTLEGALTVSSGGSITYSSGSSLVVPVQTVSSSATTITNFGVSNITGTTAGPTYLIANPGTGVPKWLNLAATSSGATHRAIIAAASTGVSFSTTGANQLTLATSGTRNVMLVGMSTAAYRVFGVLTSTMGGLGNVST